MRVIIAFPRMLLWCCLCVAPLFNLAIGEDMPIGPFSISGLVGWQSKEFRGSTDYQLINDDGTTVLQAHSDGSASALIYNQRIDLRKTPWLNWRWRVEKHLNPSSEQTKTGDDYAARLYVIIDGGIFRWRSKAVNYVWSSQNQKDISWPNAYIPKNAMMLPLRNQQDQTSNWYFEKRNVLEDFEQAFGTKIDFIDAIAIMTDTDNTAQIADARYGDIFFSSE